MKLSARLSGAAAAILLLVATGCGPFTDRPDDPAATGTHTSGRAVPGATEGLAAVPEIVPEIEPSVVTIRTAGGQGSGVVYKADGTIVTSAHVVQDRNRRAFEEVEVLFADGQRSPGTVVAIDPVTDIGVIRAERGDLPVPQFAGSPPTVGELVVVVGSPLGLTETVTAGIVSGLHREMPPTEQNPHGLFDLIQTDAAISPGNSGGAAVDSDGTVIGLSEAYLPPQSGAVSIGFITPASIVTDVADQLIATGEVEHPYLGIQPNDITPQIAERYGLPTHEGVLVVDVVAGSPAAKAGLRPGDIVTAFGGTQVKTVVELLSALRERDPGAEVEIVVTRDAGEATLSATLTDRPS